MLSRRSLLIGACGSVCVSNVPAQSPEDLAAGLAIARRFVAAGIPARSFSIASGNMEPTLQAGDSVLVDLRPARQLPKRGDILVIGPDGSRRIFRVVGMPGEKVSTVRGRLVIDGVTVPRLSLAAYSGISPRGWPFSVPQYEETIPGGVAYRIIEADGDSGFFDNVGIFSVPESSLFVVGDNRDRSLDSRDPNQGFVPVADIVGRVVYRFWQNPAWLVAESSVPGL